MHFEILITSDISLVCGILKIRNKVEQRKSLIPEDFWKLIESIPLSTILSTSKNQFRFSRKPFMRDNLFKLLFLFKNNIYKFALRLILRIFVLKLKTPLITGGNHPPLFEFIGK